MATPEIQIATKFPTNIQAMIEEAKFLEPTSGRCVVMRDAFQYSGRIAIPEKYKQLPTTGRVVGVGDEDRSHLLGRRIVWGRFSGVMINFDKRPVYDILTYEEIIGFVNDEGVKMNMEDLSGLNRTD